MILSPGYGTSTLALTLDTVDTNFPEFLFERGYDVWVFDYRASPELESSKTEFSIDDIAKQDYPTAVTEVLEATGADSLQVAAHCVGSLSFSMALLAGLKGVRSGICSQVAMHPVGTSTLKLKAKARLPKILDLIGIDRMSSDFDPEELDDRMLEMLMKHYPSREKCDNPTCHRLLFIYGEVYSHAQLNELTHETLHEMFGRAGMSAFAQLADITKREHVVDKDGEDTYLPNFENAAIPLLFIHGEMNNFFLPEGTQRTYDFLREHNDPSLYKRHIFPGYAHMDCFIGKNAHVDIFPTLHEELERFN